MTEQTTPTGDATPAGASTVASPATPPATDATAAPKPQTARDQSRRPPSETSAMVRGKRRPASGDAPLYRVTKKAHFIDGRLYEPGAEVRYAGIPGTLLEPLDKAAEAACEEAAEGRAKRKRQAEQKQANARKLIKALANA